MGARPFVARPLKSPRVISPRAPRMTPGPLGDRAPVRADTWSIRRSWAAASATDGARWPPSCDERSQRSAKQIEAPLMRSTWVGDQAGGRGVKGSHPCVQSWVQFSNATSPGLWLRPRLSSAAGARAYHFLHAPQPKTASDCGNWPPSSPSRASHSSSRRSRR